VNAHRKLSIVVISWNDREVLEACLASVYKETREIDFEVILTDNGSTDGSVEFVRTRFPEVKILESDTNRGFAGANNRAFSRATGEYVLVLNPDTLVLSRAIEKLVRYADASPSAGAWGCRILNPDGSYQKSAYPIPTIRAYLIAALYLRGLGRIFPCFSGETYHGWDGWSVREIGFQAGCCLLVRRSVLDELRGFDETLFHQFEDADLCFRVHKSGRSVNYFPLAEVVHLGGQNRGRYPLPVILETHRSRYRFFAKHYGLIGARRIRWVTLLGLTIRFIGYSAVAKIKKSNAITNRLTAYRTLLRWHWEIDPAQFVDFGREPDVGIRTLRPTPLLASDKG
jgi:GT2 family glycosyltransferase